jgi:tRNA (guanine-N7-)-methyltransferase
MRQSLRTAKPLDIGQVGLDQEQLPPFDQGPIDLRSWFGDAPDHPLDLEIGSGKGTFLAQHAAHFPGVNYIGLEYARAFWRYAADRIRRGGLTNVRVVCIEAELFVRRYVPDECCRQVHIYFPDPWPKKRHHKRRLIQTPFLRQLNRVLGPQGCVQIATDHEDYFQWIVEHAQEVPDLFEQCPFESVVTAGADELVGSNFERKYRRQGRPFYALTLRKRVGDGN